MKKNVLWMLTGLALVLAFGLVLGGCDLNNDDPDPGPTPLTEAEMNEADFGPGVTPTTHTITTKADFVAAKNAIEGGGNYVLNITVEVDVEGVYITPKAGAVVSLRGGGTLHRSTNPSNGLFELSNANSTLILRDAGLKGHAGNDTGLVYITDSSAEFVMHGGTITGNSGRGVEVSDGTFTMNGGTISGNTFSDSGAGGGVSVYQGTFTMTGGTISGNTTDRHGGGVWVYDGTFTKTGGTIYGGSAGTGLANTADDTDEDGYDGHAVFWIDGDSNLWKVDGDITGALSTDNVTGWTAIIP
ncbi:hypothetical protein AGMMS49587_03870 [Spirochaetia bacterium]|nr:hypothetical protein AGMMS49587_03870 [Spirochaetia bacterium]